MKIAFYSTKSYDRESFEQVASLRAGNENELVFFKQRLDLDTISMANGCDIVCCFVNDNLNAEVLTALKNTGIKLVALRCAGYNNVDVQAALNLKLPVVRVPNYTPYAVAEHAVALILALNRHIHRAYARVRESDFSLQGLLGFDLHGKTVGIIGTGKIGAVFANIMHGFGCNILGVDSFHNPICTALKNFSYVSLDVMLQSSDIISLHCPLTKETYHMINKETAAMFKKGVMLINTSRGGLLDTQTAIDGLKDGSIGYLGLDVYEEEENLFFRNLSDQIIQDDLFARLQTFPNVLITSHQAFFTKEALKQIAETTLGTIKSFQNGELVNALVG